MLDASDGHEIQSLDILIDDLRPHREASLERCLQFEQHRFRIHWSEVLQVGLALSAFFGVFLGILWYCQCAAARKRRMKKAKGV